METIQQSVIYIITISHIFLCLYLQNTLLRSNIKNIDSVLLICNNYWYFVTDGNGKYIFIRGHDGRNSSIAVVESNVDVTSGKICNIIKMINLKADLLTCIYMHLGLHAFFLFRSTNIILVLYEWSWHWKIDTGQSWKWSENGALGKTGTTRALVDSSLGQFAPGELRGNIFILFIKL